MGGIVWVLALAAVQQVAPVSVELSLTVPADGTVIGSIDDVDVLPDGRVVVLDGQAGEVLVFNGEGQLSMRLGGKGEGPGEIGVAVEVEVGPDGTIVVADPGNRRFTAWSSDGGLVGSARFDALLDPPPGWAHGMVWSAAGLFLKTSEFMPGNPVSFYDVPPSLEGSGTLVADISAGDEGPTCVFCPSTVDDRGTIIVARGDTLYEVAAVDGDGEVTRQWTRGDLPAVERTEAELETLRSGAGRIAREAGSPTPPPDFPRHKTRFGPHGLGVDEMGRLWTHPRSAEGVNGAFDVFAAEGVFLGTVRLEDPVGDFRIRGPHLVVSSETSLGEPVARLYRLAG